MNSVQREIDDQLANQDSLNIMPELEKCDATQDQPREEILKWPLGGIRHILVPTDLAQDSLTTIRQAIRLAQHSGSRLTLLHVYEIPIDFDRSTGNSRLTESLKGQRQAEEALKEQGASVRAAYPNCDWVFRAGDPAQSVVDIALQLRVDLIVISSHHQHWCDRYRQTNNADQILGHASCPVLEVSATGEPMGGTPCLRQIGTSFFSIVTT